MANEEKPLTKDLIYGLLKNDVENGKQRNQKSDGSFEEYVEALQKYVNKAESLDATNLPQDFQLAWYKNNEAWREHWMFCSQEKELIETGKLKVKQARKISSKQLNKIQASWEDVKKVAVKYEAQLPDE